MVCYFHITVALSLSSRTWLPRDQSRANVNKIASLDKDWVKITLRWVSTVFHNTVKRKWGEMWKKTSCTPDNFPPGGWNTGNTKALMSPGWWQEDDHLPVLLDWVMAPYPQGLLARQTTALVQQGGVGMTAGVMGQRWFCPASYSLSLGKGGRGMKPCIQSSPRSFNCIIHTHTHTHTSLFSTFSASITGDKITVTHNYNEKAG